MKTILLKGETQNEHTSKLLLPFLGTPVEAILGIGWGPTTPTTPLQPSAARCTPRPLQRTHKLIWSKCTCSRNLSLREIPVPSFPIRTLSKPHPMKTPLWNDFLHLWFKKQKPEPLLYQNRIWQYSPCSKRTRNTHGENVKCSGSRVRRTLFKARWHSVAWVLELRQIIQSL